MKKGVQGITLFQLGQNHSELCRQYPDEWIVMHSDTKKFNKAQAPTDRAICELLAEQIDRGLFDFYVRV